MLQATSQLCRRRAYRNSTAARFLSPVFGQQIAMAALHGACACLMLMMAAVANGQNPGDLSPVSLLYETWQGRSAWVMPAYLSQNTAHAAGHRKALGITGTHGSVSLCSSPYIVRAPICRPLLTGSSPINRVRGILGWADEP